MKKQTSTLIVISIIVGLSSVQADSFNSAGNSTIELAASSTVKVDSSNRSANLMATPEKKDSAQQSCPYPYPYFKSGDAIQISVYPDTALFINGFYRIDQDGYIDLPILGLVSVKDKTRNDFITSLKKDYADYLRYPNINVTSYIRVSFFGGFFKPGVYWIEPRQSIWDAVQIAGGVNREDGLKQIRWERNGMVISNNITTEFQTGTSLASMGFRSGDQLCVTAKPKMRFWESFRQDVIPILSFSLTALTTALTAYSTYKIANDDN